MNTKLKILHLEDSPTDAELVESELKKGNIQFEKLVVGTKTAFVKALKEFAPDIILADHTLTSFDSFEAIRILKLQDLKIPFILVTATVSDEYAVEVMKAGADDYIPKDRLHRLPQAVLNAIEKFSCEKERERMIDDHAHLAAIVNASNDGIISKTLDGIISSWNIGAEKLFGYSAAETLGKNISIIIPPDCLQEESEFIESIKRGESVQHFETVGLTKNGTRVDVSLTISPIKDNNGKIIGAAKIVSDITDRKQAEQILYNSEEKYHSLFENSLDAILLTVTDGKILAANPAACTMFGMSEKEICEAGRFGLVDTTDPRLSAALEERQRTGKVKAEVTAIRKNGETFPGEFTSVVYKNANGEERTSMIVRDISERKLAEQLLIESETFNKGVLSSLGSQIAVINEDGNIISVNKAWDDFAKENGETRLSRVSIGSNYFDVCKRSIENGDSDAAESLSGIQSVLKKEEEKFEMEYPCHSLTEQRWFNLSVTKFGEDDSKVVVSHQNITQRKIAEQKLQKSESRLNEAQAVTKIGSWETDLQTFSIVWSDETHHIFETDPQKFQVTHEAFLSFIPQDERNNLNAALENSLNSHTITSFEHRIITTNGGLKHVCERWKIFRDAQGQPVRAVGTCQDITERKTAENKLNATSNELEKAVAELHKILDSSLDVICTINADGEFVNVSAASQQVWGYAPEALIGTKFMNLVYAEDLDITTKAAEKIARGIQMPLFENRYVHKNGKVVPILWSVNWDEKLQLMFCIAKDVTEKKNLEKATENQRDQFYDMFLKAPSAIGMLKGANHVFEMANPLYLQLIGKKDIIGKTVAEVLPEVKEQGFVSMLDQVYQTGESYTGTEKLVKVDTEGKGELTNFYINFVYQAYRNGEGEIEGVSFFLNNITEQIISRKVIEKSEKQYRHIVETAQEGIWQLDENGKIIFVNKRICEILEYTEEEILGKEPFSFMDVNGKEKFLMALERRKKGIAENYELGFISKNGKHVLTNISANPIFNKSGNYKGTLGMVSDITEKNHLEVLLEKSNRLAVVGSWEIDVVTESVYWSDITKEIREVDKDYVPQLGEGISYFKEGIHRDTISQKVQDCIENGTPWDEELKIITFKGNEKWVRTIGEGNFLNEKCIKIHGSFQDITDRKNAETKIRESEQKYRKLATELEIERTRLITAQSVAKVGNWETDLQTWQVNWSEEMYRLYGTDPNNFEPSYLPIQSFVHPEDRKMIDKAFKDSLNKSGSSSIEHRIITLQGIEKWVEENWSVTKDEKGSPMVAAGTCQDITESKKAADKVIRSEAKLKVAQRIAQVGSYEVDMVTNKQSWSDEFYRILGVTEEVIPSREAFMLFVHPDDRAMAVSTMEEALSIYADSSFQFRFIRKNGESGYALSKWKFEFDSHRNPLFIHGILRDLTKEKKAENERAKMISDIVQRNSDLEQFSYMVSHNLRAPTANIIGFAEILEDETLTPQEQKESLQGLSASVTGLDAVIKDINTILQSKQEVHEKKEPVIFSKLVNDIKMSIANLIDKHRVRIISDFSDVAEIYSLKIYIYSIFYNLISNSIKYGMPNVPPLIEIKSKKENGKIILIFIDNGLGMDMTTKEDKIFGLYNRFHSHVEGKGMGLFMVKTQVELLGGKIAIASELNKGTKFTIEFEI
ncbi:PAS domain S-box protein [Aequorivita sp. CIP111184]|uniref:PAS domain S-box protein n=1 Tax=Aequorivita sp. CIP111184 TaxID=2211356 RepID=UPI000DBC2B76|nr:PAS domain S-box protein [Aequorivita sp. CIP111184]SRX55774.1 Phytochrome-like protein cph1 [Aequorivita sp. CIP111184]